MNSFKRAGFKPRYEAVSVAYNRYVGFDPVAKQALYVDISTGGVMMDFDKIDKLGDQSRQLALIRYSDSLQPLPNLRELV